MTRMGKNQRSRGSRTHGRGRGKSHNCNAGNRGGRGRAGSGKKGDAKKPSFWGTPFKKVAFGMIKGSVLDVINVSQLDARIKTLVLNKKVKAGDKVTLDLTKLGFNKLLGSGKISCAVAITVAEASESAVSKIEAAGGEVTLPASE